MTGRVQRQNERRMFRNVSSIQCHSCGGHNYLYDDIENYELIPLELHEQELTF